MEARPAEQSVSHWDRTGLQVSKGKVSLSSTAKGEKRLDVGKEFLLGLSKHREKANGVEEHMVLQREASKASGANRAEGWPVSCS